jgi:hypothetical protein
MQWSQSTYIVPFNTVPFWPCVPSTFLKTIINGIPLPGYRLRIQTRPNHRVCAVQVVPPDGQDRTGRSQRMLPGYDGLLNFSSAPLPSGRFTLDQVRSIVAALPLDPYRLQIQCAPDGLVDAIHLIHSEQTEKNT